jgi:ornithine--oxo-acid transaminase
VSELDGIRTLLARRAGEEMALNDRYLNPQMGRILRTLGFDRRWVGGDQTHLIDADGERYLDLIAGYGVFALGRNHPEVVAAVQDVLAAGTANLPQLGVTLLSGILAEQLLARAPGSVGAMVPANTGTEAVEAAMKIARAATGRPRTLYADHAFHGLTLGSLSINGNEEFRAGFGPLLPSCEAVPFGDTEALARELAREDVAALILEPIQGKGVNLPPAGYLASAQRLCHQHGTLFVCDEVQTGLGRTGRFLALEHWDLAPDMICLSKALSGGLVPIGAVLVSRDAFDRVFDGMERAVRHGSTFGGNDLAAAAALATLRVLDRDSATGAHPAPGGAPRGRARRPRRRADVGHRARPTDRRHLALAVSRSRLSPAGSVRSADHGSAVPRAPHPLPGRGSPPQRHQGAPIAAHRGS